MSGDIEVIAFNGESDRSANINLNVPLPGAHTGRRIIEVSDISGAGDDTKVWSDFAITAGTPWSDELGIDKAQDGYVLKSPEKLIDYYLTKIPQKVWKSLAKKDSSAQNGETIASIKSQQRLSAIDSFVSKSTSRAALPWWLRFGNQKNSDKEQGSGNTLLSEVLDKSLENLTQGKLKVPAKKWGGGWTETELNLKEKTQPRLFIIQVFGVSSFLGDYGLGRTVKTFTLLPGEETTISTRTWRSTEQSRTESTSIIDSFDDSSSERFADSVMSETTNTATSEQATNWHAEAEATASWGFGSASATVSGGAAGESASSTEEFSKSVDESLSEHAYQASNHRENSVTASSEASEQSEDETVVERVIKNINVKRTLNFVFRELNQSYITKTHLKDIRIAFSNGNKGSWMETPLSDLAKFMDSLFDNSMVRDQATQWILQYISTVFDKDNTPHRILERVQMGDCGCTIEDKFDAIPGDNCDFELPPLDKNFFYRFKRGDTNNNFSIGQEGSDFQVQGVLMRERNVTLRTDSVIVEALLGVNNALDEYSEELQNQTINEKHLANGRETLAQQIINDGDELKANLFDQIFNKKQV